MTPATARGLVRRVGPDPDPSADAELVSRFARTADPAAFAALVRRHGPMVLAACRRMLPTPADAEDAFQAVFLVLVRKAGAVRPPGAVGGWLHGVAVRTAQKARVAAARRRRREMSVASNPGRAPAAAVAPGSPEHAELRAVLDEELARLPAALRAAVVLCDLGGKTRAEAAADLGCPEGTVAARLHRARKVLAGRLGRRGITAPAALAGAAAAAVPSDLLAAVAGFATGGPVPAAARALAEGVVRSMIANPLSLVFAAVTGIVLAAGAGALWASAPNPDGAAPAAEAAEPAEQRPAVADLSFNADGTRYLVVAGGSASVKETATDKTLWVAPAEAARFTPNPAGNDNVATLTAAGVVLRSEANGTPHGRTAPRPKADAPWRAVRFSADGFRYAAHTGTGVRVFVTTTGAEGTKLAEQYGPGDRPAAAAPAADVFFSPDGTAVFGLGVMVEPGNVGTAEWAVASGHRGRATGGDPRPTAAAYSPDGDTIAIGYADRIVLHSNGRNEPPEPVKPDRLERTTLRPQKQLPPAAPVTALAYSPDGKLVAAGVRGGAGKLVATVQLLDAATGKEVRRVGGFAADAPVTALAFSPDGRTLLAGTGGGEVKRITTAEPPLNFVTDLAFAPDGKTYLVVAGGKATVRDTATDKVKWTAAAEGARFTADGNAVMTMGNGVERRAADTGQVQTAAKRPRTELGWHTVAFTPEGARYAAHFGFEARVYDAATGAEPFRLERSFGPPGGALLGISGKDVRFSPDGKLLAAVGVMLTTTDMGAAVWDAETGKRLFAYPPAGNLGEWRSATAAAFSPDGKAFAVALGKSVRFFETARWAERVALDDLPGSGTATALAISPDGTTLAVGYRLPLPDGADKGKEPRVTGHKTEVLVIDLLSKDKAPRRFDGFEGVGHMGPTVLPVSALAFSPDGTTLLAGTGFSNVSPVPAGKLPPGEVKRFTLTARPAADPPARWREKATLPPFDDRVHSVAFSPDGKALAVGGRGGAAQHTATMWDATSLKKLWAGGPVPAGTTGVAFSPDGKLLAATRDKTTGLYEAATGQWVPINPLKNPPLPGGAAAAFGLPGPGVAGQPQFKLAVTDGRAVSVVSWFAGAEPGTATFGPLKNPPKVDDPLPAGVAFSPSGRQLVFIPNHKIDPAFFAGKVAKAGEPTHWVAQVWGGGSGEAMMPLAHGLAPVTAVAWSPDGKLIASGCRKGDVVLWDAKTFKEVRRVAVTGRTGEGVIHALAFAPDGKALAAAVDLVDAKNADRVVMLDPATGERVGIDIQGFPGAAPRALAFAPDGKTLAVGLAAWKVARNEVEESGLVKLFTTDPEPAAAVVDTVGKHLAFDGRAAVEVLAAKDGRHDVWLSIKSGPAEYTHKLTAFARAGEPWFAYAESPTRLWAFDGRGELALYRLHDTGRLDGSTHAASFQSSGDDEVSRAAPPAVRDRLPAAFRPRPKP